MPDTDRDAFQFLLRDLPDRDVLHDDPAIEFFREQVLNLLDVVVLTCDGEPLSVDGFRLAQDEARRYDI